MQPVFTSLTTGTSTTSNVSFIQVDFGERLQQTDPYKIINMTYVPPDKGFGRIDMLFDVLAGQLYIIGQIKDPSVPTMITMEVPPGITTDLAGNPVQGAKFDVVYTPENSAAAEVGAVMQMVFASAGSFMLVGAAFGVVPPSMLIAPVSRAQVTYLVGELPGIPQSYTGYSDQFSFVALDYQ